MVGCSGATHRGAGCDHKLVTVIYDAGSKGKSGRTRREEAQKLVQETFRLVDLLVNTTSLTPMWE